MTLEHRQQPGDVGCLYFSAYAVTGDAALLTHAADTHPARYQLRLIERGYLSTTLFAADAPEAPASPRFWEALRHRLTQANFTPNRHAPLLVSIAGVTPGWQHQVAILLPIHESEFLVCVSDSNFAHLQWMTWEEFLATYGAHTHRVEMLGPADVAAYPDQTRPP